MISQTSTMMGGRNDMAGRSGRHNQQGGNKSKYISVINSTRRTIGKLSATEYKNFISAPASTTAWNEADSNADTCCLGKNFIVMAYTERTADVYPYDSSYTPLLNVPIVTGMG